MSGNAGDHGAVHLHRAPRAEFLTAEAVDAAPAVDVRPAAAADAQRPLQARPRPQRKRRRLPEQAAKGAAPRAEIRPRPMLDDPEIRAGKGRGIPRNTKLRLVERRQTALGRCAQRRHILRLQPSSAPNGRGVPAVGPFPSMATTASTR